jgi:MFS family permease
MENNISFVEIGILYASREIITNALEIPSGIIADTYGRKNALVAAFAIYIMSYIVFYFSNQFIPLLVAMLLIGIGDAFRSGTHKGMIMDYLKLNNWGGHKIMYYGYTRSWSQFGSAISSIIAGFMVFYSGSYRIVYLMAIIPYLLNFINIITYPNELNFSSKKKKEDKTKWSVLKNLLIVFKDKSVLFIVNSTALHSAFLKSIKDYIQPIMVSLALFIPLLEGIDTKRKSGLIIGGAYFFIYLLTSFASKNAGKVSSLGIKNMEIKSLLLGLSFGLLVGLFFKLDWPILSLIVFVMIYIIENIRKPILTGFLADQVPNEILVSVISTQSSYQTFIAAVFAILLGALADNFGIGIALISVSILLMVITVLIRFMGRVKINSF